MLAIILWGLAGYLGIGVIVTVFLSQTPYADNAWWLTVLVWPLFFAAYPGLFVMIAIAVVAITGVLYAAGF